MPDESKNGGINGFFDAVKEIASDFTTLDVLTLTGTIKLTPKTDGDTDLGSLVSALRAQLLSDVSNLRVVAFSHKDRDLDVVTYVQEGLSQSDASLISTHNAILKASEEGRIAFLKFVAEVLGLKLR